MNSKFLTKTMTKTLTKTLTLTMALTITACSDDDKPYIEPTIDPVVITRTMADSIWMEQLGDTLKMTEAAIPTDTTQAYYDDYTRNWLEGESTRDVVITFDGDTATCEFVGSDAKEVKKNKKYVSVYKQGAHIIVRNDSIIDGLAEGRARMNYILKGQSQDASIRFYSNKKFMITLDNAQLSNSKGSVINVQKSFEKKRVFINVIGENYIADATQYTDTVAGEDDKGAIFSEGKMIISGPGILKVEGNYGHAIASDDRIHIHSGVMVDIQNAVKDGLHAKEEVVISGGWTRSYAQKDAIEAATLEVRGGCLMAAGSNAVSAPIFTFTDGSFCLLGNKTDIPTSTPTAWEVTEATDYVIVTSSK